MIFRECFNCKGMVDESKFRTLKSGNKSRECNSCRYKKEKSKVKKIEKFGPIIPTGMKQCNACKKIKSEADFSKYLHKRDNKYRLKIDCKNCRRIASRNLYKENRDKYKENSKVYYEKNKDDLKAKRAIREKIRRRDSSYKLRQSMYSSIRRALIGDKSKTKMLSNVGYSINELASHLERQFNKSMNWGNYGTYWNVDHIIPVSEFSYESERDEDFLRCWSLSNLRPLSIEENIKKSNKLTHLI